MTSKHAIAGLIVGLVLLTGCAAFQQARDDVKACMADPRCREAAISSASTVKATTVAVAGVSPVPLSANVIGGAAYGIALLIALLKGGRKKRQ